MLLRKFYGGDRPNRPPGSVPDLNQGRTLNDILTRAAH